MRYTPKECSRKVKALIGQTKKPLNSYKTLEELLAEINPKKVLRIIKINNQTT